MSQSQSLCSARLLGIFTSTKNGIRFFDVILVPDVVGRESNEGFNPESNSWMDGHLVSVGATN